ncbi:MAG: hypothetical protein C0467_07030 [Planctomycetaceae bacterium]|nr:hypothetical protein [Planctomycetaceae bacterium]
MSTDDTIDPAWALLDLYFEPRNLAAARTLQAPEPPPDVTDQQLRALAVKLRPSIEFTANVDLLETLLGLHGRVLDLEARKLHERDDVEKLQAENQILRNQVAQLFRIVTALQEPIPHDDPAPVHQLHIAPESGVSHE